MFTLVRTNEFNRTKHWVFNNTELKLEPNVFYRWTEENTAWLHFIYPQDFSRLIGNGREEFMPNALWEDWRIVITTGVNYVVQFEDVP